MMCGRGRLSSSSTSPSSSSTFIAFFLVFAFILYLTAVSQSAALIQIISVTDKMDSNNPFKQKIVHFDLKGAPPRVNYFRELFPLLKRMKVKAVLMEYEDMFPYNNKLAVLKRNISYTNAELEEILKAAAESDLEVVPLVQTFGHMEFVLKHPQFVHLREHPLKEDTICTSDDESWKVISEMLRQVRVLHPASRRIHIGADEATNVGTDVRCLKKLASEASSSIERLKLEHISRIARYALEQLGFEEVFAWNDMFAEIQVDLLKEYKMGELLTPVIWGYAVDVTRPNYFPPGMFVRYAKVFPKMFFGSAYKGANGMTRPFINIDRYLANHKSYVQLYQDQREILEGKIKGIMLTGWQRFHHRAPLCEILPLGVPSLIVDLVFLNNIAQSDVEVMKQARAVLGCEKESGVIKENKLFEKGYIPWIEAEFMNCSFPGSAIYDEIEKLRYVFWRNHRLMNDTGRSSQDIDGLYQNIRQDLTPYFYPETVEEILSTQLAAPVAEAHAGK